MSLGILFIFLTLLILAVFLYFITEVMADRLRFCKKVRNILKAKLFYNAWIRYMIESNLKMTHNCIFFLYVSGSFLHTEDKINTISRIFLLIIIVFWPMFTTTWLLYNRKKSKNKDKIDFSDGAWPGVTVGFLINYGGSPLSTPSLVLLHLCFSKFVFMRKYSLLP